MKAMKRALFEVSIARQIKISSEVIDGLTLLQLN